MSRTSLSVRRRRLFAGLFGALLLSACADDQPGPAPARPSSGPHLVTAISVERAPVVARQERPGSLRLRRLVRLFSQEEGRITDLDLYEGDQVRAGQTLVQLDDDLLRAELDKARATAAQERLNLERLESLARRRAAADDEVARARTELAIAEADLRLLETRLDFTLIRAPFAGVITERLVEPGDFATKNTHLLTLADPASLVAEVAVSELVLPQLAVGDAVRIRLDALGGTWFDGRILRIHPTLSASTRQARVEVRFDAIPDGARAGQFARVELATAALPRLLVPFRAVQQERAGAFVWVVDADGRSARRPVETGLRIADSVEVLAGLEPGEQVITRGFLGLAEGRTVEVTATGLAGREAAPGNP